MIYNSVIIDIKKYLDISLPIRTWINFTAQEIVSNLINLVLVIAFVVFLFLLLLGGIQWITSGGDKDSLAKAKGKITSSIIGIVVVLCAWAILNLVKYFFGISSPASSPSCGQLESSCGINLRRCCSGLTCQQGVCVKVGGSPF